MSSSRASLHFEPVVRRRLHETVVRQILLQILSGELPPGSSLPPETELGNQFGVSRITIRQAIQVLVNKGLVAVRQGSGMQVEDPERWDQLDPVVLFERVRLTKEEGILHELAALRRAVEVEAAGLAATYRNAADLQVLSSTLSAMNDARDDIDRYTRLDTAFHEAIVTAAHASLLEHALRPVSQALAMGRLITARQSRQSPAGCQDHEEVFRAIDDKLEERARQAMRRHIMRFEQDILTVLREGLIGNPFDLPIA